QDGYRRRNGGHDLAGNGGVRRHGRGGGLRRRGGGCRGGGRRGRLGRGGGSGGRSGRLAGGAVKEAAFQHDDEAQRHQHGKDQHDADHHHGAVEGFKGQ